MRRDNNIYIIILTYNSEGIIEQTLKAAKQISQNIFVVDSFSDDTTLSICKKYTKEIVQRKFTNYSDQRNWAMNNLQIPDDAWIFHLDADEILTPELILEINDEFNKNNTDKFVGYLIRRRVVFLGNEIRHGALYPNWHCRLFRKGVGRCEDRLYDQHFVVEGLTKKFKGYMLDVQSSSLSEWVVRHDKWSTLESQELADKKVDQNQKILNGKLFGTPIEQKRWIKDHIWTKIPLFIRPFVYFLYAYIIRFGFLDGRRGLIYNVLQAFWFRFLVDAKIYEIRLRKLGSNGE